MGSSFCCLVSNRLFWPLCLFFVPFCVVSGIFVVIKYAHQHLNWSFCLWVCFLTITDLASDTILSTPCQRLKKNKKNPQKNYLGLFSFLVLVLCNADITFIGTALHSKHVLIEYCYILLLLISLFLKVVFYRRLSAYLTTSQGLQMAKGLCSFHLFVCC